MPDDAITKRFETLLAEFVDGALEDERVPEFMALLEADASRVDALRDQLMMDARLAQFENERHGAAQFAGTLAATLAAEADGKAFVEQTVQRAESQAAPRPAGARLGAIRFRNGLSAAAVLAIGLGIGIWLDGKALDAPRRTQEKPAPESEIVARFTELQDVQWMDHDTRVSIGDPVRIGQRIELSSGSAKLVFHTGARLNITGPAIVELRTAGHAILNLGEVQLVADTPESKGFTVETPTSTFVDIGTAFTATVSPDGLSRVKVSEGEVDAVPHGSKRKRRLKAGQALYVEPGKRKVLSYIESGDGTAAFLFPTSEAAHPIMLRFPIIWRRL